MKIAAAQINCTVGKSQKHHLPMKNNPYNLKKHLNSVMKYQWVVQKYSFLILVLFIISCYGQNQPNSKTIDEKTSSSEILEMKKSSKINLDHGVYLGVYRGILDSEGNLWFITRHKGIYLYDGSSFTNFSTIDGLPNDNITSIMEDKDGLLWFGYSGGLCSYDRKTFTHVPIPYTDTTGVWLDKVYPIVNPNEVMSILQDKNGIFWLGTNGAGVYRYDRFAEEKGGKKFTQYLSNVGMVYEDGMQHNIVLSISEDLSGNIWFTSLSHAGVSRYNGDTFTHFMPEDGLSDDFIRSSFVDKTGNVWIGTHGNRNGGLDRFDAVPAGRQGQTFTNYNKKDGLCSNNVQYIYQDKEGNLWLGSGRGNLCVYDGKTFKEFRTKDGESFDGILCILEDVNGNIWFSGKNGLWKVDGEDVIDMTSN